MSILPLRGLGTVGVVTDVDPYDLPPSAFSFAKNVRFEDSKVQRGPVFRKVAETSEKIVHLLSHLTENNEPQLFMVSEGGEVIEFDLGGETDRSITGYTPASGEFAVTSAALSNILYVNREDRVPWYKPDNTTGISFEEIPNDVTGTVNWPSNGSAKVLRSLAGVLVAGNITKGASTYPNMIKWSNYAIGSGVLPADWDYTDPASNAGENSLGDMKGDILDMLPLRDTMYIYSDSDAWAMEFIGGLDMFRFSRRFDKGIISGDCTVEQEGIHYAFGPNDLWMHDGINSKPLATGKVRRFIFDTMRRNEKNQFFVTHNARLNEILFCYVSDDQYVKFPALSGKGCNRAVCYNYISETFTFADLPYVTCAAQAYLSNGDAKIYSTVLGTFDTAGGSFAQLEAEVRSNLTFGSDTSGDVAQALRTFEAYGEVETGFLLDEGANATAFVERTGYDLDEINAELRGYKLLSSVYPQGRLDGPEQVITFTIGLNDHPSKGIEWSEPQTFTMDYYKLDYNVAGRYLSMRFEQNDFKPFTISGLDLDISLLGSY